MSQPVPAFDIDDIVASTDVIAVVQPLDESGRVSVLSIIQGSGISVGDRVDIITTEHLAKALPLIKSPICIFLKKGANEAFTVANRHYPWFRIDSGMPDVTGNGKAQIENILIHGLLSKDDAVVSDSAEWLTWMKSRDGGRKVIALYDGGNRLPEIQAVALQLQVPAGNQEVLRKAMDFIAQTANEKEGAELRWNVAWSFSKIEETDDVAFMNNLLTTAPPDIAKALCFSAQAWSDKTSIPFLIKAMREMDEDGKYRCVLCLGELTGKFVPGYKEFMSNPAKYVAEWENWYRGQEKGTIEFP